MQSVQYRVRTLAIALGALLPATGTAQTNISGIIRDSLAGTPFIGATVQIVPSATPWAVGRTVITDSIGRYQFAKVTAGRYTLGFQHPRLDSLGLDPISRTIDIDKAVPIVRADLAVPSGRTFVTSLCGAGSDTSGAVIGRVFNADENAVLEAGSVVARWGEMRADARGIRRVQRQVVATFGSDGRYVACGLPTDAPILVMARTKSPAVTAGAPAVRPSTSGEIELTFAPNNPLIHRDLLVAVKDSTVAAAGTARVAGRVITGDGRPVKGARVTIQDTGISTITDSTGTFRASAVPEGTRTIEVVAIGFTPVRSTADLRPNRETAMTITIGAKVNTLAGVKVTGAPTDRSGFAKRRAEGTGFFLDANMIEARGAMNVASALVTVPGLRGNGFDTQNPTRPIISGRSNCKPKVYLDGQPIGDGMGGVDDIVTVRRVGGIEVYSNPQDAPAQFASGNSCAVILVWSRSYVTP